MQAIVSDWPRYYGELLHVEDNSRHIGVVTLWAKKEIYMKRIDKNLYNTIGQLYSREEGLSALVRNLLANKHITDLVIVGVDLNHCADALLAFFKHGVNEKNEVENCEHYSKVDDELTRKAIDELRAHVTLHDARGIKDPGELNEFLKGIQKKESYGMYQLFDEPKILTPSTFPSDGAGFKVRGKTISDVWFKVLKTIDSFGHVKQSQYSEKQREVIGLTTVVTDEDPLDPKLIEEFGFTKEELEAYIPQVTSAQKIADLDYTYGQRLMDHEGVNQITSMIEQLNSECYTRRAVACTWNVKKDHLNPKAPCLDLVQALVDDNGKLHMTCYFRSNDMYGAWPRNAFALRALQNNICKETNIELGNLVIISNSAHYYERSFNKVKEILENHERKLIWDQDPYGTIVITTEDDEICITHLDISGKRLEQLKGKTALEVYRLIASRMKISDISHAMDIGCELQKAEIAIKLKIPYKQDQPLHF